MMKAILAMLSATLLTLSLTNGAYASPQTPNPDYDAALAKTLGADERGMKLFVMVTLVTGPNDDKVTDKAQRSKLFQGHFANMTRLANEGKLVLAGPFVEARPKRGLWILDVTTLDEAEALIKTDPTVKAGVFDYELTKFYGSAALVQVNELSKKLIPMQ